MTLAPACSACGHRDWIFSPFERDGFRFSEDELVYFGDVLLDLTTALRRMMIYLASEDVAVSHERLIAHSSPTSGNVASIYACKINAACRSVGAPKIIQNEWGYGYRWSTEPSRPKGRTPKPRPKRRQRDYIRVGPMSRRRAPADQFPES